MTPGTGAAADDAFRGALQDGETLTETVQVGAAAVGVTDRRLLVRQGANLRAVDLTNVRAVRRRTLQDRGRLSAALQWGGLAAVLIVARAFAPLESLVAPVEPPPDGGFDALYAAVAVLVNALRYLDEAFLAVAILSIALAGWHLVAFYRTREDVLEVTVAGGDPVRLPSPGDPTDVDRLRGAVGARSRAGTD
ncbi:hypothetical protein BRC85_04595 [Halobacteriales archaeon QS_1_69_70]|nr:MAG: hypothetical protein BRC85_04595 [Halobacteriales archaeon QS_1_69_70]